MNSATWFVEQDGRRWVAKAVAPDDRDAFAGGLAVAEALDRRGVPSGRPQRTRAGELLLEEDCLALLAYVPGEPLTTNDKRRIGATLGRVHTALDGLEIANADRFHWVDPDAEHLRIRTWLRPAVKDAVEAYDNLGPLSWGLLHADPAPDAFRGDNGIIDWASALYGPHLYDLASAAMYLGGPHPDLIDAYLETSPLDNTDGLEVMLRFRFAVQADYFARRIVRDDLTGLDGPAGNEKGLEDARRGLNASRAPTSNASRAPTSNASRAPTSNASRAPRINA
jgi:Ser/Thr protein kinase RdoA (MazF antagonist)